MEAQAQPLDLLCTTGCLARLPSQLPQARRNCKYKKKIDYRVIKHRLRQKKIAIETLSALTTTNLFYLML